MLKKSDFDQTGLHQIKNCENLERRADIIFVHGLTGHAITTWHPEEKCDENCWPFWLGEENEFKDIGIWSFGYKAPLTGDSMSIYEQAGSLLNSLLNEENKSIAKNPIIFITHSLGGLVIKQMLNIAYTVNPTPNKQAITNQIKGIVFLASPHQGSHLANIFTILSIFKSSVIVQQLKNNNPDSTLSQLNDLFAQKIQELGIKVKVFYETESIKRFRIISIAKVVERDSAKLSIPSIDNEAVSANHINIAKPKKGDSIYNTVYKGVRTFIRECLISSNQNPL
ncbi:hypothetical protein IQ243_27765 [Nostocales cyanobacterium LEGE 11386]|nr:hypothetical protein [Nostocales cyanobacterium LEGE 11386]